MQKRKTMIIVLLVFFVLLGGGGGYLLWRVNQEDTVAPTDSDAGKLDCLDATKKVTLKEYNMITVTRVTNGIQSPVSTDELPPANTDSPNDKTLTFTNSCDTFILEAKEKKGAETFTSWDVTGLVTSAGVASNFTNRKLTIKFNDFNKDDNKRGSIKPTYKFLEQKEYSITYKVQCGYDDKRVISGDDRLVYLSCTPPGNQNQIMVIPTCLDQTVLKGADGKEVYSREKVDGCDYAFTNWLIQRDTDTTKSEISQTNPDKRTNINTNYTVTAVYTSPLEEKPPAEKLNAITYSVNPPEAGYLMLDNVKKNSPLKLAEGEPGSKLTAEANEGYEFVNWKALTPFLQSEGEDMDSNVRDISKDRSIGNNIHLVANFKKKTTPSPDPVKKYTLTYIAGTGGKLSKNGGEASPATITEKVSEGGNGPTIVAVANEGYVFKDWSDGNVSATRKDEGITGNINVTARFTKEEAATPPVVEPPVEPPVVEPPVVTPPTNNNGGGSGNTNVGTGGNNGGTSPEKMPETAAFSDKSLYIITFGTLVLSLGMIWQYIPFKKFRFRK